MGSIDTTSLKFFFLLSSFSGITAWIRAFHEWFPQIPLHYSALFALLGWIYLAFTLCKADIELR